MKRLYKDDWRYALLLVVLFSIASLATKAAIDYVAPLVGDRDRIIVTLILCALTLGLMLISSAFALWFISSEAKQIGSRHISDIVDSMSYIKDAVLALNSHGKIIGANPAARKLIEGVSLEKTSLIELCPGLSQDEVYRLLKSKEPHETECDFSNGNRHYRLRLRSQTSRSTTLLLINDVTSQAKIRARQRHSAYLQLIGHISQGIANDFNNILCGIAGHTSLIMRSGADEAIIQQSAAAINDSANRGIQLVGSLLGLSESTDEIDAALTPARHVNNAVEAIAANLHSSWDIIREINEGIPPTALAGNQIEHIIQGLGMLAADEYNKERKLFIQLATPADAGICQADKSYAAVIIIAPTDLNSIRETSLKSCPTGSSGTIQAVVASILTQCNGKLECFRAMSGIPLYRICLPPAPPEQIISQQNRLPLGLEAYIDGWKVMLCHKNNKVGRALVQFLKKCQVEIESTNNIVELLAHLENNATLQAIIIHSAELGSDPQGLLRAIAKLCPNIGILVLENSKHVDDNVDSAIIHIPDSYTPARITQAMIEARTRARSQHSHA